MIETVEKLIDPILMKVMRPGRYVGHELNMIRKEWRDIPVRFVLAFPDVYEIGMSHPGMQILYHICNQTPWLLAERVYSPWVDMESLMRERDIPLFSLESMRPVRQFDMLGITLQYELHYTNILNILDLSGIPIKASDRSDRDPLVIAGGPLAFNPEPVADFLDAVVLGDGEVVILEIAQTIRQAKREQWPRKDRLKALARLKGVYVPQFYKPEYGADGQLKRILPTEDGVPDTVEARISAGLDEANYPEAPLVPLIEITQDRFSMEIMRGCGRGCRFCNAGMIYRPVRTRSINHLADHARKVISHTGFDEIALVSLSSSDYPQLLELLQRLNQQFRDKNVSISFPSLRVETFTPEMADYASVFRKSGLTFAPEAGTQRLRDVVNKNNCEEDLIKALQIAFERNWQRVKLYFMIGLPTETMEDISGIAELVGRVVSLSKKYGRKEIHVSISPFSPKPFTPFQWQGQDSIELLEKKTKDLKEKLHWREVKLSWRDPIVSQLECVLGLGDRRLGSVIFHAWKDGARFDGWSDRFRGSLWVDAFKTAGYDPDSFVQPKDTEAALPWDHLNKGISREFLLKERAKSLSGELTQDCFSGCSDCGLGSRQLCIKKARERKSVKPVAARTNAKMRMFSPDPVKRKLRFAFRKEEQVRFTSHLDTMRIFARTFRRAGIPVVMSQGFHSHPRVSAGPPLPLGYTSRAEYFDVEIFHAIPWQFVETMNKHLPEGFAVFQAKEIDGKTPSLSKIINLAVYQVTIPGEEELKELTASLPDFLSKNSAVIQRSSKTLDIRPFIRQIEVKDHELELRIRLTDEGTARVEEVLQTIQPAYLPVLENYSVCRTGLYIEKLGGYQTPFEDMIYAKRNYH